MICLVILPNFYKLIYGFINSEAILSPATKTPTPIIIHFCRFCRSISEFKPSFSALQSMSLMTVASSLFSMVVFRFLIIILSARRVLSWYSLCFSHTSKRAICSLTLEGCFKRNLACGIVKPINVSFWLSNIIVCE